ncbi:MAG: CHAT domain-containing protein, partial [Chloroflexi bacterium]
YQLHGEGVELHIARARANKAVTLAALGRFREAVALHEQARATFATHGEKQEISVAREEMNIADIYLAQGHFSQALHLYNQSRELFRKHNMSFAAEEVAQQMCECLVSLNRAHEAYELASETVEVFRTEQVQDDRLPRSLMHLAMAAMMKQNYREAADNLQEATDLFNDGGFVLLAAQARFLSAKLRMADGQLAASLHEAQVVADVFADQENLPYLARTMLLQAQIADKKTDNASAQFLCEQALDIAQGQDLLELKYQCYDLLGQLAERNADLATAAEYYDRAVQGIDDMQSRLIMDERMSFLENKGGIYQRAMVLAQRRGNKEQAWVYVEKAKSRVLGDYLRNNIDIRLRAGDKTSEALRENLARLREEQAGYSSIVYGTENEANLSDTAMMRIRAVGPERARKEMQQRTRKKMQQVERRIEQELEKMQLFSADELAVKSRTRGSNGADTSQWKKLPPHTLMLEYYLDEQNIYIFALTQEGVDIQCVEGAASKLARLMSLWRTNLEVAAQAAIAPDREQSFDGIQENSLGLLQRLYDLLLKPVEIAFNFYQHILIVPYGALHYLPFHCLFDGEQFLIERLQISYLPAAALLDICDQRGQRIKASGVLLQSSLVLGLSDGGRLPFAVQEAQVVARQLGTRCYLNEDATTSLLQHAGARSPIVHIAAHGVFRLDAPNFSFIKLADRQLSTIEAFNLDLTTCSLVTLSACETGRAVVGGVDEVIGLGRGFLYAGAASLLPTLWKVDDASSAELMTQFYQALLQGHTKAAALAEAQRTFLTHARASSSSYRAHPYFWAAFHLIGDAGPLLK